MSQSNFTSHKRCKEIKEIWKIYAIEYRLLLILLIVAMGAWIFGSRVWILAQAMQSYTTNVFTETLSIIVTIFVLDRFTKRRIDEQELTRLKALLASNENVVTKIAIAELRAKGWLEDGSLKGANLIYANLAGANLNNANLEGVNLYGANLSNAKFYEAHLREAQLNSTNLKGTTFTFACLERANMVGVNIDDTNFAGADLRDASLLNAQITGKMIMEASIRDAVFARAILPDGSSGTIGDDISRFIDMHHPNSFIASWVDFDKDSPNW